jgi:hypothetical protein
MICHTSRAGPDRREHYPDIKEAYAVLRGKGAPRIQMCLDREIAERAKKQNVLDMALTFTGMMRVFSTGSKQRIARKLGEITARLYAVKSAEDYERLHKDFCEWFCREIRTAIKTKRNTGQVIKPTQPASFGQAAKVLDIALKVYIFYCVQRRRTWLLESIRFFTGQWTGRSCII